MTSSEGLKLVEITGDEHMLLLVYRLRVEAWRTNLDLPKKMTEWSDAHDAGGRHWAFLDGVMPVASGRLSIHASLTDVPDADSYCGVFGDVLPAPIASMNRLVVHPLYRSRGLSSPLDEVRMNAAEQAGAKVIIGSAGSIEKNQFRLNSLKAKGFDIVGRIQPYTQGVLAFANHRAAVALACPLPRRPTNDVK